MTRRSLSFASVETHPALESTYSTHSFRRLSRVVCPSQVASSMKRFGFERVLRAGSEISRDFHTWDWDLPPAANIRYRPGTAVIDTACHIPV